MKFLISIGFIIILIFIQASLFPYFQIFNAFPNLILIGVLIISILKNYKKSLIWIFLGGWLLDIYSFNNPLGISILSLLCISYFANFLTTNIFKKFNFLSLVLICTGCSLFYRVSLALGCLLNTGEIRIDLIQVFVQIIYNLVVFLPIFYLIRSKIAKISF